MENTLVFEEGKYGPKIETLSDYDSSIFKDIYDKGFKCLNEILVNEEQYDNNNIIAFIGERGGGKTSCMMSFEKILLEGLEKKSKIFKENNKISSYNYSTLDTIDPSFFTEKSNILEIIIATLFKNFKEKNKSDEDISFQKTISRCFKNVYKNISIINNKYNFDGENYDKLQDLSASITLKEEIKKLVKKYLEFMNKNSKQNKLIIKIDDIDLNIKYSYEMVEQIRKYLIQDNIIILMAVKLDQLEKIIKINYIKSFDTKIGDIDLNYNQMSYRYLEKLIPQNRRLYLISLENQLKNINIKFSENNKNTNIETSVRQLIFEKLRILFLNDNVKNNPIVPKNLRFLINFINIFIQLEKIEKTDDSAENQNSIRDEKRKLFKKNIVAFDNYFLNSWIENNLTEKNIKIIKELHDKNISEKNKYIVTKILEKLEDLDVKNKLNSKENISQADKLYKINKYKFISTNISLGDVLNSISNLERVAVDNEYENFLIAIKILYARYIYDYYLDYKKKERENKESLEYSDFEIFLGGEVIISRNLLYNPENFENINPKIFYSKLKEIFENEDKLLKDIENVINNKEDPEIINKELKKIECIVFLTYFFKDVHAPKKRLNGNLEDFKQLGKLCDETFYNGIYDLNIKSISTIEFDICSPFFFNLSEYRLLNRYTYKDQNLYNLLVKINERIGDDNRIKKININHFKYLHLRNIELIEKVFKYLKPKSTLNMFDAVKEFYKNFIEFKLETDINEVLNIDYADQYSHLLNYFNEGTTKEYFNEILFFMPSQNDIEEIIKKINRKKSYKGVENLIKNDWLKIKFNETIEDKNKKYDSDEVKKFFSKILDELDESND